MFSRDCHFQDVDYAMSFSEAQEFLLRELQKFNSEFDKTDDIRYGFEKVRPPCSFVLCCLCF